MAKIDDGTGSGSQSRVDENNRLHVHAVNVTEVVHASEQGGAVNINTGYIPLASPTLIGTENAILYFVNNEQRDFVVEAVALGNDGGAVANAATTFTGRPYIELVRNPTGGTIVSGAVDVDYNENRDFGSSRVLAGTVYKGAAGNTLTGGDVIALLQASSVGRDFYTINFVVPQGSALGLRWYGAITAGTANIYAALIGYLRDPAGQDE